MSKLLIVDDEINAIDGLKIIIDAKKYGITTILAATNALSALKIIEEKRPEIIISDISMPKMTGLEMIERVNQIENYAPKIMLLSGYSDFKYAQAALGMGVRFYLLKPIDDEELDEKLTVCVSELASSKEEDENLAEIERERALLALINSQSEAAAKKFVDTLHVKNASSFAVMLSDVEIKGEDETELSQEEMEKKVGTLRVAFNTALCRAATAETVSLSPSRFVTLFFGDNLNANTLQGDVNEVIKQFYGKATISAVLTSPTASIAKIFSLIDYAQSTAALSESKNECVLAHNVSLPSASFSALTKVLDDLANNFETIFDEELDAKIDEVFKIAAEYKVPPVFFYNMFYGFLMNIVKYVADAYDDVNGFMHDINEIKTLDSLAIEKAKPRLVKIIKNIYEEMTEYKSKLQNEAFHNIIVYVNNNYTENLTLKSLAQKFYVNPIYLGRVFKKNTGTLFNEYVTELRIEKSKVLLVKTNKKIYEIADEIGFNDPNYFIAKFLKSEGVTPSAYRKQQISQKN